MILFSIPEMTIQLCFGYLFNWYVIDDSRELTSSVDWSVPSITQVQSLADYLGASGDYLFNNEGGKLKETGLIRWASPNTGASDVYGLSLVGSGQRLAVGTYQQIMEGGLYWTTDDVAEYGNTYGVFNSTDIFQCASSLIADKKEGRSIRLVKLATGLADGITTTYTSNDGKTYNAIVINELYWTITNLAETKFRNGDWITGYDGGVYTPISDVDWSTKTTEAMCVYDDDLNNM